MVVNKLKKFLSVFFSIIFAIFGILTANFSYATSDTNLHTVVLSEKKLTDKEVKNIKGYFNISDKQLSGIQNIVNHPFSIIIYADLWGTLGSASTLIFPIATAAGLTIGTICGGTLAILNLYKQGYENGYKG